MSVVVRRVVGVIGIVRISVGVIPRIVRDVVWMILIPAVVPAVHLCTVGVVGHGKGGGVQGTKAKNKPDSSRDDEGSLPKVALKLVYHSGVLGQ